MIEKIHLHTHTMIHNSTMLEIYITRYNSVNTNSSSSSSSVIITINNNIELKPNDLNRKNSTKLQFS